MHKAYSVLTVKAVEDDRRVFHGVATTPTVDRVGDIIEPKGVQFKNPLPLLWQHNHDKPIGTVKFNKPTDDGIEFEAELPDIQEEGTLRDRVNEAWQSIKAGLIRGVSIGFRPIEYSLMDTGGIRFMETEVFELSAVTIPANAEATITNIKKFDTEAPAPVEPSEEGDNPTDTAPPAASGQKEVRVVRLEESGVTDHKPFVIKEIRRA